MNTYSLHWAKSNCKFTSELRSTCALQVTQNDQARFDELSAPKIIRRMLMDFSQLIEKRYSVRLYRHNLVEQEKLQKVLEAARLAPTAANHQPFQLIIVHTGDRKAELQSIYSKPWFSEAPLVICVAGIPGLGWVRADGKPYLDVDAAIVMTHIMLAAAELGLGTCCIASFDIQAARRVLGLPKEVEPILFTPLGYPSDQPEPKERKPLTELVRYERW
jgi:nitroreductase